jgi:hypothetical protein
MDSEQGREPLGNQVDNTSGLPYVIETKKRVSTGACAYSFW